MIASCNLSGKIGRSSISRRSRATVVDTRTFFLLTEMGHTLPLGLLPRTSGPEATPDEVASNPNKGTGASKAGDLRGVARLRPAQEEGQILKFGLRR